MKISVMIYNRLSQIIIECQVFSLSIFKFELFTNNKALLVKNNNYAIQTFVHALKRNSDFKRVKEDDSG